MLSNRVGPPVRGMDFYGRDDFVRLVWEKLSAGNVLLAAPRRFGKTSVMYRLIDDPKWDYKIVHADLEHLEEPADLIAHLVVQIAKDDRLSKVVEKLSYFPKTLWFGFKRTFEELELLKVKFKLRQDLRGRWQESGEELFKRISESSQSIIFILDEFPMMIDRMARSEEHRKEAKIMLHWLRGLRQSPNLMKRVRFLIAGSIGIGHVLNDLGDINAINDFEQVKLEPFSSKVAESFLDELAATHKAALSKSSKKKMLELIGVPIPYFIQVIFSEVAKTHRQDNENITPKKIEKIYRDKVLGTDCKTYFDHYYGRLRDYYRPHEEKAAKRILREIALFGMLTRDVCYQLYIERVGEQSEIEEFSRLMTDLENDFYVRYDLGARKYDFACKLLRDWWLRHYGMETGI